MLSDEQKIIFLKDSNLFKDISLDSMKVIASITNEVYFNDDEDIFTEGDSGDAMYLIIKGYVRIHALGKQIAIRGANEFFGEMAIIDDRPRSATATSIGKSILLRIDRNDFFRMMQNDTNILRNLLKALVSRLRDDIKITIEATKIKQDLLRARELNINVFPSSDIYCISPSGTGINISGICYLAESVGGDYYDYFYLSDRQVGIAIGDVMGHGFYSGLMVFTTKSCLETQIKSNFDISDVISVVNTMVYKFVQSNMFMTFCYIIVNMEDNVLSYCNAGHNYPYHYRHKHKKLEHLESNTYPIGISENLRCEIATRSYDEGDILVLYTDGITEALDRNLERFGNERLEKLIIENAHLSAPKLKELIIDELNKHCQQSFHEDDITLVVAKIVKEK